MTMTTTDDDDYDDDDGFGFGFNLLRVFVMKWKKSLFFSRAPTITRLSIKMNDYFHFVFVLCCSTMLMLALLNVCISYVCMYIYMDTSIDRTVSFCSAPAFALPLRLHHHHRLLHPISRLQLVENFRIGTKQTKVFF